MARTRTFLMFVGDQYGKAEEAVNLYASLFERSEVLGIDRYGADEGEREGAVRQARFTVAEQEYLAMDSGGPHAFTFTPAMSIFVDCESEGELGRAYEGLADGATVLMPLEAYPFSPLFAWLEDRYGVSWQLHLPM